MFRFTYVSSDRCPLYVRREDIHNENEIIWERTENETFESFLSFLSFRWFG